MSVALNGSGYYTRASYFGLNELATWMAWFYPTTLPGNNAYKNCLGNNNSIVTTLHKVGANPVRWSIGTQSNDFDDTTISVAANTWYHVAIVVEHAGGTGTKRLFINGIDEANGSDAINVGTGSTGFVVASWDGTATDAFIGRIAAIKVWRGIAMTAAEVFNEMNQIVPVRPVGTTGLFLPFWSLSDDEVDFSGNGLNLTVGGTGHATADGPPVPWKADRTHRVYVTAAAPQPKPSWIRRPSGIFIPRRTYY